jgi:hypothetical protein
MPAATSSFHRPGQLFGRSCELVKVKSHKAGTARATRQNADAVGPVSAMRTKIGDSAMQVAPSSSAASAGGMEAAW